MHVRSRDVRILSMLSNNSLASGLPASASCFRLSASSEDTDNLKNGECGGNIVIINLLDRLLTARAPIESLGPCTSAAPEWLGGNTYGIVKRAYSSHLFIKESFFLSRAAY